MFTLTIPGISESAASQTLIAISPTGVSLAGNRLGLLLGLLFKNDRWPYAIMSVKSFLNIRTRSFSTPTGAPLLIRIPEDMRTTGSMMSEVR